MVQNLRITLSRVFISFEAFRLTLIKKDCQNGEHRKGRVFIEVLHSPFCILAKGRSPFHLSALEATFIKTSNPILCRQKEFVYNLKILHVSAEL